jgi:hypothetical protein
VDACHLLCVLSLIHHGNSPLIGFLGYSACVYDFALDFSLCALQGRSNYLEILPFGICLWTRYWAKSAEIPSFCLTFARSPMIHAPRPRHIIPPLLDCRSARNSAYDFQPPALAPQVRSSPKVRGISPRHGRGPYTSTSFYNSSVQKVFESGSGSRMPPLPRPVQPR